MFVGSAFVSVLALIWAFKDKYASKKDIYSLPFSSTPRPATRIFVHSLVSLAIAGPMGYILANFSSQETKENLIHDINSIRKTAIKTITEQEKTFWAGSDVLSSWPRKTPFPLILSIDNELAKWKIEYASLDSRVSKSFSPGTSKYCRNARGIIDKPYCILVLRIEKETGAVEVHCQFFKEEVDELLSSLQQCAELAQYEASLFFIPKPENW